MADNNPRAGRVAALIHRVIASATESKLHDKRLHNVTITEVRVTRDLQIARVYWTQLAEDGKAAGERERAKEAFKQATGRLRSMVGSQLGLRLTPHLQFLYDEVPQEAHEIEDVLAEAHRRDEELKRTRADAHYAGDPDPYRHDADKTGGTDESDEDDDAERDGAYDEDDFDFDDDLGDDDFVSESGYAAMAFDGSDPFDGERADDDDDDADEDHQRFVRGGTSDRSDSSE